MKKTRAELEEELRFRDFADAERIKSDELYAIKRIETIVFSLVALILTGFVYSLLRIIWK
jgi:lipopolysaccharide/colanic/teichoic acid biosynthesis glycosyltransferase